MEKFLGITIDSNFTFKKRINGLCKNEDLKLHALNRCVRKKKRKKTSNIYSIYNLAIQLLPFSVDVK